MTQKFRVELLEEANEFLNGLNNKAREKIIYNIRKAQVVNDNELFKKLNNNVWEFRTLHNKTNTGFLLSGTKPIKPRQLSYRPTESKRKLAKPLEKKLKRPSE